jgi:hypothetical protein
VEFWIRIRVNIHTHALKSYILLGGEGKEVPVQAMKLYDLYFLPNISLVIKSRKSWAGHAERMEDRRGVCRVLVRRLDGKRPLGTHM